VCITICHGLALASISCAVGIHGSTTNHDGTHKYSLITINSYCVTSEVTQDEKRTRGVADNMGYL
jgi:hypothetical protein